jgi:hypothetical protein
MSLGSRGMARKELGCEKTTSYMISSYSEAVINPLSGYHCHISKEY